VGEKLGFWRRARRRDQEEEQDLVGESSRTLKAY
jgi:hypothetical protein